MNNYINMYELKLRVNFNYHDNNEILLIMFNNIMSSYPNKIWSEIIDDYLKNFENIDTTKIMIYTILSYKLGKNFINSNEVFREDLITSLNKNNVNPYKLTKYAENFLNPKNYSLIIEASTNYFIKPINLFNFLINDETLINFDLSLFNDRINYYISKNKKTLFNGNYNFYNVYSCLKKLITNQETLKNFENIPLFNTIKDEFTKRQIKKDFAYIETCDKSLNEKINDLINIADHYKYYLP